MTVREVLDGLEKERREHTNAIRRIERMKMQLTSAARQHAAPAPDDPMILALPKEKPCRKKMMAA